MDERVCSWEEFEGLRLAEKYQMRSWQLRVGDEEILVRLAALGDVGPKRIEVVDRISDESEVRFVLWPLAMDGRRIEAPAKAAPMAKKPKKG